MCGTLDYLPPEMVSKGENDFYDKTVDIWSIGVLTYEFLVGRPPFESNSAKETYARISALDYEFPENISQDACDFINACLQAKSGQRAPLRELERHRWLLKKDTPNHLDTISEIHLSKLKGSSQKKLNILPF